MTEEEPRPNWKLDLRYGRLSTPFKHFTLIADGVVGELQDGFTCPAGPAFMAMKAWASDTAEASDMVVAIGRQIGFSVTGKVQVYETETEQPPGPNPHGYAIGFTPYGA